MSSPPKVLPSVIWQAYERIVSHQSFQHSDTLSKILRCLLAGEEDDERFDCKKLTLRVYGDDGESHQQALRSSIVRLRRQLQLYYAGPGANDPIIIEMQGRAYRATATVRPKTLTTPNPGVLGDGVPCQRMGDDTKARRYLIDQYRQSLSPNRSPRLISVQDTHVRAETQHTGYRSYEDIRSDFSAFLGRPETSAKVIVGWSIDEEYIRALRAAATGLEKKIQCRRLRQPGPIINFIILNYDDGTSEVLFGWGLPEVGATGAIFKSDDPELVNEFRTFYEVLDRSSDPVAVDSLLEVPAHWQRRRFANPRELQPYRRVFHQYHLTQDHDGQPMWSYYVLDFRRGLTPDGNLFAQAYILPKTSAVVSGEAQHQYDHEASIDHGQLIVRTSRSDGAGDLSLQVFPNIGTHNFPWCGASIITSTWHNNPASAISIWSDVKLPCAASIQDGDAITNPKIMQELESVWRESADRFHFAKLSSGHEQRVRIKERWDHARFDRLLQEVEPSADSEQTDGDLRIVTTFFINESSLRYTMKRCLARGVKIRILVMNPANTALMNARFGIREDRFTPDRAIQESRKQIEWLKALPHEIKPPNGKSKGDLVVRISDIMPTGFVVHTRKWAVVGLMPARESYEEGPMIETSASTDLWTIIDADWKARWRKSKAPKKGVHY